MCQVVIRQFDINRKKWIIVSMLFSLNFVKCMGIFCKVFAAYKQVRDFTAFLYQIAGILLLLSTTIIVWYLSKDSVHTVA